MKGYIILPNWDSDRTVTALSFYYRIVNVFNQQICLVNALHIFTPSFSATKSNSYLVASINSQHLNHMVSNQCHNLRHFIMMYSVIFVVLTAAPRLWAYGFNQCMSHWKKIKNTNIFGHNKPEKVQFIKYTQYDQVGIDCLDLNHTKDKDVFVKHKCHCLQLRSNCRFLV